MSRCYALNKKEKPCHSYATVLEESNERILYALTCSKHTHFFRTYRPTLEDIFQLEFIPQRTFMENAFKKGLLYIDEDFIRDIPVIEGYTYFYLLCAKYLEEFEVSWNNSMATMALRVLWRLVGSIGPYTIGHEELFTIIRRGYSATGFYVLAICYPTKKKSSEKEWLRFFQQFLATDMGDQFLHSDKHEIFIQHMLAGADKKVCSPVFMDLLQSGKIMQWIKAAKEARYSVLQGRCRELKDALLETAWSPDRFYEWCIDSEEKMFIGDALSA